MLGWFDAPAVAGVRTPQLLTHPWRVFATPCDQLGANRHGGVHHLH